MRTGVNSQPRLAARGLLLLAVACCVSAAVAAGVQTLDTVEVIDAADNLLGTADSASQGTVRREQIEARPNYRPGEILEAAPGVIVTQHSGEGKANQYFLRGINLDHGTDLAITVDGMPVNQRTHGHGQGYSDLNFLISDIVSGLQYKKGPYYADEGDFSAAGAMHLQLPNRLDKGFGEIGGGAYGYRRLLLADSPKLGNGNLLYALEVFHNDGPWTRPDDFRKFSGLLRYGQGTAQDGFNVTAMAYQGTWNATNQIPKRAVDAGLIGRFDTLDRSDGGDSSRYSLSGAWNKTGQNSATAANAYVIKSRLSLWNNFTFFQDDPVNGDQFEQIDKRVTTGFNAQHSLFGKWGGREVENTFGMQVRNDNISVGLFNTAQRVRLSTTRADHVVETSAAAYYQNSLRWNDWFRTVAGLRADFYTGQVTSDNPLNSGKASDHMFSPKMSLIFGPWAKTEYYFNYGRSFHSNDMRGATISVAPKTGLPATREALLVRATGAEVGMRTAIIPHLQSSLAVFALDIQSELLFAGDAGTTADSGRSSRRVGFEFSNLYTPNDWLVLDADIAFTRARFTGIDFMGAGDRVPGAIEGVATFTAAVDNKGPYYGSMRLRYFGPRPLIEDNTLRSNSTTLLSGRVGYKFDKKARVQLDVFNLLNRRASQIDYAYTSQLRGEAAPVNDIHFHPSEPRSFRISAILNF